jgi:hypothetical protein
MQVEASGAEALHAKVDRFAIILRSSSEEPKTVLKATPGHIWTVAIDSDLSAKILW